MGSAVGHEAGQSFGGLAIFRFGEKLWSLQEMLAWAELVGRLTEVLEILQHTEEALQSSFDMDQDRLQQAVNDFRYRNNLITSAETHDWLEQRSLSLDDLYSHLYRQFCDLRKHLMLTLPAWQKKCTDCAREVWTELHFSSLFIPLVNEFISRIAVADSLDFDKGTCQVADANAAGVARVFLTQPLMYVAELERMYQRYCEKVADRDSCQRRLKAHRLNLLKIKYQGISFKQQHAAKEAFCCIKYDGESVESLANRTHGAFELAFEYVEDLPETVRQHLLSAKANECLEPIRVSPQKGYTVYSLQRKTEPHLNNQEVRNRLQQRIVTETLSARIERQLEWLSWETPRQK